MQKKKITIEDLARLTQKGFNEVGGGMEKRFNLVDKRFEFIDKRLEKIEIQINEKFNRLITTLDKFLKRITDLEDEFEIMKMDINRMKRVIKEKLGVDIL